MNAPVQKKEADILHLCVCCKEDEGTIYAADVAGMVCHDCRKRLISADAWLKHAGIKGGCTLEFGGRLKGFA